jgi:hypothetical protein
MINKLLPISLLAKFPDRVYEKTIHRGCARKAIAAPGFLQAANFVVLDAR